MRDHNPFYILVVVIYYFQFSKNQWERIYTNLGF